MQASILYLSWDSHAQHQTRGLLPRTLRLATRHAPFCVPAGICLASIAPPLHALESSSHQSSFGRDDQLGVEEAR